MNSPPPRNIHAAVAHHAGFYVWRDDAGKPDVYKHHAARADGSAIEHWERIPTIDDVRDASARIALKKAWSEDANWRAAHAHP